MESEKRMGLIMKLKNKNRTLLELISGILFLGLIGEIVVLCATDRKVYFTESLLFGILLAIAAVRHMYHTLDRALDLDPQSAQKKIFAGYLIRYFIFVAFLLVILKTGVMNPLVVFAGCMSLKGTAYLQPFTHRIFNRLFHEEDPVPAALPEEESEK